MRISATLSFVVAFYALGASMRFTAHRAQYILGASGARTALEVIDEIDMDKAEIDTTEENQPAIGTKGRASIDRHSNHSDAASGKCCCRMESERKPLHRRVKKGKKAKMIDFDSVTCRHFAQEELEGNDHCPHSDGWHKISSVAPNLEELVGRTCPSGPFRLGPLSAACRGQTKTCSCSRTVDAVVPANGLVKGRLLHAGAKNGMDVVAGFFGLPYAELSDEKRGRWQHSSALEFQEPAVARDHCTGYTFEQLRMNASDHSSCYQWAPVFGYFGSDACLTLNVFTPTALEIKPKAVDASKVGASNFRLTIESAVPVMIFIAGGGYLLGDKYQNGIYDGRHLAKQGRVIVVAMNYRLGVFGFLHHPELKSSSGTSMTNFGLQDQLQALKWTHQNIRSFGGDPDRITLFGESAGAMSICAHLVSPASSRLFSNAILESGNCDGLFIWQPREYAEDHGARYLRAVFGRVRGCARKDELSWTQRLSSFVGAPGELAAEIQVYKKRQYDCNEADTAPLEEVQRLCHDLFVGEGRNLSQDEFAQLLPFEHVRGCDQDYDDCDQNYLPSGKSLDFATLHCAWRLEPKYVWVNQMGLAERAPREDANWKERQFELDFTGLPLPPHLPWSPVVDFRSSERLDFATGGVMSLPSLTSVLRGPQETRLITAGFNRDEGSLFSYMLPNFFDYWRRLNGHVPDSLYRYALTAVACPDWGRSGHVDGGRHGEKCKTRVDLLIDAYANLVSPGRGSCCSSDPNTLRVQRIMTDYLFACPALRLLEQSTADTSSFVRPRLYTFDAEDELPTIPLNIRRALGAFHLSELFFVFGDKNNPGGNLPFGGSKFGIGLGWNGESNRTLSTAMSKAWADLSYSAELADWPELMQLASEARTADRLGNINGLGGAAHKFTPDPGGSVGPVELEALRELHHCSEMDYLQKELLIDVSASEAAPDI